MAVVENAQLYGPGDTLCQILHGEEGSPVDGRMANISGSDPECLGGENIAPRFRILFNQVCLQQRRAQAVGRRPWKTRRSAEQRDSVRRDPPPIAPKLANNAA